MSCDITEVTLSSPRLCFFPRLLFIHNYLFALCFNLVRVSRFWCCFTCLALQSDDLKWTAFYRALPTRVSLDCSRMSLLFCVCIVCLAPCYNLFVVSLSFLYSVLFWITSTCQRYCALEAVWGQWPTSYISKCLLSHRRLIEKPINEGRRWVAQLPNRNSLTCPNSRQCNHEWPSGTCCLLVNSTPLWLS